MTERAPVTYRDAGVDIDAGEELVERIKPAVKRSMRREVLGGLGGFGALVEVPLARYRRPVLVSGTDGVGTKLRVAIDTGRHDTVGIDLVAMCVNDVVVQGGMKTAFALQRNPSDGGCQLIQAGLAKLMEGRTTFVIAHRLSTIRRADQILVVEGGLIVERGNHAELFAMGGRYYDLYMRQHGLEANLFLAPGEGDVVPAEDAETL